ELQNYEACVEDTSIVIEQGESDDGAETIHAQSLHHCGRTEESIEFVKSRLLHGKYQAEWHCWLGAVYSEMGDYRSADEALKAATKLNPEIAEAWIHIASLGFHTGDLSASKQAIARAIEFNADEPLVVQCQSIIAHQEGRYEDAIRLNSELLELSEDDI
ncbi:unnamed protein product, partial [Hapterophycus canaliculatus]